jgi:RecB family endonuclease NucS
MRRMDALGRKVDILALDGDGVPVVMELKISRGHEKVVRKALYYKNNFTDIIGSSRARIVIIAREITPKLRTAAKGLPDCELLEYELAVNLGRLQDQ